MHAFVSKCRSVTYSRNTKIYCVNIDFAARKIPAALPAVLPVAWSDEPNISVAPRGRARSESAMSCASVAHVSCFAARRILSTLGSRAILKSLCRQRSTAWMVLAVSRLRRTCSTRTRSTPYWGSATRACGLGRADSSEKRSRVMIPKYGKSGLPLARASRRAFLYFLKLPHGDMRSFIRSNRAVVAGGRLRNLKRRETECLVIPYNISKAVPKFCSLTLW